MTQVLVTGAEGFLGRNLVVRLQTAGGIGVIGVDQGTPETVLQKALSTCDVIFHLAGVNRSTEVDDFRRVNRDLTESICGTLKELGRKPNVIFSSSIQAELDNPYGRSKRQAEEVLLRFGCETGAVVRIYRLKNLFGKWSRPNYNSVVATFCHNIANDLPIQISSADAVVDLVYVDDVVDVFMREVDETSGASGRVDVSSIASHRVKLGDLAGMIQQFREMNRTLNVPDFSVPFHRQLYATYLSYVPDSRRETKLEAKRDDRGSLAEFLKSCGGGQIFVSRTLPGVVRGNHYHHTKTEKFFVVEGIGLLRMRQIHSDRIVEYKLSGQEYQIIDIPPGYTHSIENVGSGEMVTLFWADEVFDPGRPDTYYLPVDGVAVSAVSTCFEENK